MKPPKILKRSTIYQGRVIRLVREELVIDGRRIARETILHPGAVVVVPVLGRGRIVFVRQYRRAVRRFLLELPAGTLERGERRDVCARRELEEETGYRALRMRRLGQFFAAPGFISEQMTLFVAEGLTATQASPEPDEMVSPVILTLPEALRGIRTGRICDAKSIIGVLFAERLLSGRR